MTELILSSGLEYHGVEESVISQGINDIVRSFDVRYYNIEYCFTLYTRIISKF